MSEFIMHYCHVCHERASSPPDGRCEECREAGREFVSFSEIPAKIESLFKDIGEQDQEAGRMTIQDMEYYTFHEVRMVKRQILSEKDPWDQIPGTAVRHIPEPGLAPMLFVYEEIRGENTDAVVGMKLTYHGALVEMPDLTG